MPGASCSCSSALFGVFTVLFGLLDHASGCRSRRWRWWAPRDMVSVTIRETIMQLWTPEEVRGRVNAVNSVFIGASNELGEFRAGTVAHLIGPVAAVVIGGVRRHGRRRHLEPASSRACASSARSTSKMVADGPASLSRLTSAPCRLYHAPTYRASGPLGAPGIS